MLSKEEMIKRMQQEFEEQGDQQEIVDFNRNHAELNIYKYGEIKMEQNVITYNGKIYVAIDSLNSNLKEVQKKWEDAGYEFGVDEDNDAWVHESGIPKISFYTYNKSIVCRLMDIPFEIYDLMTRTVQALGWYNAQN